MEGVEQTKVKYVPSGDTLRNPCERQLKFNDKRQDCKIGTVCVWNSGGNNGREMGNEGD
jgi:hypothetical protein